MFLTIVIALLLVAAIAVVSKGSVEMDGRRLNIRWFGLIPLALALIMFFFGSVYVLNAGEAAVFKTFGAVSNDVRTSPGIGLKAPWTDIIVFDIRNQTIKLGGDGKAEDQQGSAVTSVTSDNATVTYDATIRYSLNPGNLATLVRQYPDQEQFVVRAVMPGVASVTRDAPTTFPAATVRQSRSGLIQKITTDLESRLGEVGVKVEQVDPSDITLDQNVQANYDKVQSSLAAAEAAKANLQTALANAEITKTDAQAQSDADQIIRCGATSTTKDEVINGKTVQAVKVIPVPSDKCQNRLNEQVLTSKYIEALKQMADKGNLIVVPQGFNGILNLPNLTK